MKRTKVLCTFFEMKWEIIYILCHETKGSGVRVTYLASGLEWMWDSNLKCYLDVSGIRRVVTGGLLLVRRVDTKGCL